MSETSTIPQTPDGVVFYSDGSFRGGKAGWGVHGYAYDQTAMKKGVGLKKVVPSRCGYVEAPQEESVTPLYYIDAFGHCAQSPSNNVGELTGAIRAIDLALDYNLPRLLIISDSEYVIKGLTKWVKGWQKNNWIDAKGQERANRGLWEELLAKREAYTSVYGKGAFDIVWTKGHAGNAGNDRADTNARSGSGRTDPFEVAITEAEGYHNHKAEPNPLILKTRMVFNMNGGVRAPEDGHWYYFYQLGSQSTYGHKQGDTKNDRIRKLDTLLGRRISDATFCVLYTDEPDALLDQVKAMHEENFLKEVIELGTARLDAVYRPINHQRMMQFGVKAMCPRPDLEAMLTAQDELVTKTLNPPRLAREAIDTYGIMHQRLRDYLQGGRPEQVHQVEITDRFFETVAKGKKADVSETRLLKEITTATTSMNCDITFGDQTLPIKLLPGIDIPGRNALSRIAAMEPRVVLLITLESPQCYSYATVFETSAGAAMYQAPYTQLVTPKELRI